MHFESLSYKRLKQNNIVIFIGHNNKWNITVPVLQNKDYFCTYEVRVIDVIYVLILKRDNNDNNNDNNDGRTRKPRLIGLLSLVSVTFFKSLQACLEVGFQDFGLHI